MRSLLPHTIACAGLGLLLLPGCYDARPVTPTSRWLRTAPEHLGLSYEKLDRELGELGADTNTSALQRRGYLIWERGAADQPLTLNTRHKAQLAAALGGLPVAVALRHIHPQITTPDTPTPLDLLRVGLLILNRGDWPGTDPPAPDTPDWNKLAAHGWISGTVRFENAPFHASGSPDSHWLILLPDHDLAFCVLPAQKPLADPEKFANILAAAMHVMRKD